MLTRTCRAGQARCEGEKGNLARGKRVRWLVTAERSHSTSLQLHPVVTALNYFRRYFRHLLRVLIISRQLTRGSACHG
jgi:hypothetical protein